MRRSSQRVSGSWLAARPACIHDKQVRAAHGWHSCGACSLACTQLTWLSCLLLPTPTEAAYRSGNQPDLLLALYRLAGALGSFPLPRGSAQGEMVGRQVAQTMDLALRKQVGGWLGWMDGWGRTQCAGWQVLLAGECVCEGRHLACAHAALPEPFLACRSSLSLAPSARPWLPW